MKLVVRFVAIAILLFAPAADSAQEPSTHSIGAAIRWTYPAGDAGPKGTPGGELSYRGWLNERVGIDVNGALWRHTNAFDSREPVRTFTSKLANYSFGASVVGRISRDRVSLVAGGGPGYFMEVRTNQVLIGDRFTERTTTAGTFGAQALFEVDVRATRNVSLFAGVRGELRDITYGSESVVAYPTLGLRFAF